MTEGLVISYISSALRYVGDAVDWESWNESTEHTPEYRANRARFQRYRAKQDLVRAIAELDRLGVTPDDEL